MAEVFEYEVQLPLKPLRERTHDLPCWSLEEDVDLESLKRNVEVAADGGGFIPIQSEDTAYELRGYLKREFDDLRVRVEMPDRTGSYLVTFKRSRRPACG